MLVPAQPSQTNQTISLTVIVTVPSVDDPPLFVIRYLKVSVPLALPTGGTYVKLPSLPNVTEPACDVALVNEPPLGTTLLAVVGPTRSTTAPVPTSFASTPFAAITIPILPVAL